MTDVDVSKIVPGDWIATRVLRTTAGGVYIDVGNPHGLTQGQAFVHFEAIVSHTPAPKPALKVGDRVWSPHLFHLDREVGMIVDGHVYFRPTAAPDPSYAYTLDEVETWERVS